MTRSLVSEYSNSESAVHPGPWQRVKKDKPDVYWPFWREGIDPQTYAALDSEPFFEIKTIYNSLHTCCSAKRMQLGLAESCTGGMIASSITDFPGSSKYLYGGWVTYTNHAKYHWLQVSAHDLESIGPVSETVVRQMLQGVLENSPCSHAIAVSGFAGPDGGTSENPIGTVWIGVAHKSIKAMLSCFRFSGNRAEVRQAATAAAGIMMLEFIWLLENKIDSLINL